ncbi:hypothetical protein BDP55DRAFT_683190 [Colletotrichum godetiae]|uniref:Uncharacterized protein n=1 Tax=Colletotrichum godetiae TaxID=1209918 RepID=A0AAJ0AB07_9PEZI|nr:uncharacterized protein BDP55DRAFT_683190 [Colletotrichum godetiae]KAK1658271.1 hypothetical protein BDP55DRAFT_683190 [Colletotrichum godetiae]
MHKFEPQYTYAHCMRRCEIQRLGGLGRYFRVSVLLVTFCGIFLTSAKPRTTSVLQLKSLNELLVLSSHRGESEATSLNICPRITKSFSESVQLSHCSHDARSRDDSRLQSLIRRGQRCLDSSSALP